MSIPNDPAAPITVPGIGDEYSEIHLGMTIRQRFVMAAMQGLLADPHNRDVMFRELAHDAVNFADAALAEEARTRGEA